MDYNFIFNKLNYDVAFLIFFKRDGSVRLMLGTRNIRIAEWLYPNKIISLSRHDSRCHKDNGNIALIDLELAESRSFNIDRLLDIKFYTINNREELDLVLNKFKDFKVKYYNNIRT